MELALETGLDQDTEAVRLARLLEWMREPVVPLSQPFLGDFHVSYA